MQLISLSTTPPTPFAISVWVLTSHKVIMNKRQLLAGTYGVSSLPERTRQSKHLQMSLERQHFLLRYLKSLSVGPARVQARKAGALPTHAEQTRGDF